LDFDDKPFCHVGGRDGVEDNYGNPCVVIYVEDGPDNCIFCGHRYPEVKGKAQMPRGEIYCITCKQVYNVGDGCLCDKELENGRTEVIIESEVPNPDAHLGAVCD
jgi:hypothetical protein